MNVIRATAKWCLVCSTFIAVVYLPDAANSDQATQPVQTPAARSTLFLGWSFDSDDAATKQFYHPTFVISVLMTGATSARIPADGLRYGNRCRAVLPNTRADGEIVDA